MTDTDTELDTRRPFTRADALKAGIAPRLFRGSRFRRLFRGVYVDADVAEAPALRIEGALTLFKKSAWASHASAARLHGVPIPTLPDEHVSVLRDKDRRAHPGIRCHVGRGTSQIFVKNGVRVSTYTQMFVELATLVGLVDLVVVGDNLVRAGRVTPDELSAFCAESSHAGAVAARRAAGYVRARVDSPMETRLRMLLVLAGLPEPDVNITIADENDLPLRRYDLSYPAVKVIVEYDGRQHIDREDNWESDLARREAIDDDGWRILVVTAKGIYQEPGQTVLRVWKLLHARRMSGLPSSPGEGWRPHFPGRD